MDHREERIVVETARHRLTGTVRLSAEGYRSRLTDHLNAGEHEFLALTEVQIASLEDPSRPHVHHRYVALGRRHIVFATSADERAADPS